MRFAVISGVQGNLPALEAVLADIDQRYSRLDRIVCAGNVVGLGPSPNEVVALLRSRDIDVARGNYDDAIAEGRSESGTDFADAQGLRDDNAALVWTRQTLTPDNLTHLQKLPRSLRLLASVTGVKVTRSNLDERTDEYRRTFLLRALFGGMLRTPVSATKRVAVMHGSPRALNEFVREDTAKSILEAIARDADTDLLITGHAETEFRREEAGVTFVGVGPVSDLRGGSDLARYAVFNTGEAIELEFGSVRYDRLGYDRALRSSGLPETLTRRLTSPQS